MTVYAKLGASQYLETDAPLTLDISNITTSIDGTNNIVFVKIQNTEISAPLRVSYTTAGVLSADLDPVVILPLQTEFIQVAGLRNTGPVYFYFSCDNVAAVYVTPVAIVGA